MSIKTIRLGTRGSDLARTQSGHVADMIRNACDRPVEIIIIKTRGDRIQDVPLNNVEGKGFFTKEIEEALLDQRIDVAVHSLKDLPVISPPGLKIGAIPAREDFRDLLLVRNDVYDAEARLGLPQGAAVGTGSRRRAIQLLDARPDLEIRDLRGNVPTRINKMLEGQYDAIVMASAGFRRLSIQPDGYQVIALEPEVMLPAPGQGALGVQIREDDAELSGILSLIHDPDAAASVEAERHLLALMGGGCGTPLAAWGRRVKGGWQLNASVGDDNWEPGMPVELRKAEVTTASPDEAAREIHSRFGGVVTDAPRQRQHVAKVLVPIIENGAAETGNIFAGLPVEYHSLPVLQIVSRGDTAQIERLKRDIDEYDWVLFASANGVSRLLEEIELPTGGQPKIGCVGPNTADLLREHGYRVEFVPEENTGDATASGFIAMHQSSPQRVLLPRPEKMGSRLAEMLSDAGHEVESVILYTTEAIEQPPKPDLPLQDYDLIVFKSPSAVRATWAAHAIPADLTAIAIGPATARALRQVGHTTIQVAPEANRSGLRKAVSAFLASQK